MTIQFTRYTKPHKGAENKQRRLSIFGEVYTQITGIQSQTSEKVRDLSAFLNEDAKLLQASDVSSDRYSCLGFTFDGITIYLTAEQLDQMQPPRS